MSTRRVALGEPTVPAGWSVGDIELGAEGSHGLDAASVVDYLTSRGIAPAGPLVTRELSGGVSSTVLAVEGPNNGVVVKRALARLRVEATWRANPERTLTEARAIELLGAITPDRVPKLVDVDAASLTIVIEEAPRSSRNWREITLEAPADPMIGRELGETLARWHEATWAPWERADEFDEIETFEQLRLRPFHGAVAARYPRLATKIELYADELRTTRQCLVHGDFSPKNVLVGPSLLWVIDFEVAHVGHPIFDVAFLGSHLALTAIARPEHAQSLRATWLAFHDRYRQLAPPTRRGESLGGHLACLVLARTDGLSPEPGLDDPGYARARALGIRLLARRPDDACSIWDEVTHALA